MKQNITIKLTYQAHVYSACSRVGNDRARTNQCHIGAFIDKQNKQRDKEWNVEKGQKN